MLKPILEKLNNMRIVLATTSKQKAEVLQKTVRGGTACMKMSINLNFRR